MKVFIENEAGTDQKNIFNEETLEYLKTVTVSRSYPYPYGFILNTKSGDGGNLDCFVLTKQMLKTGTVIDAEPIGMFEEIEDGQDDSKILAALADEVPLVDEVVIQKLTDFTAHVFDHLPNKVKKIGNFLGKDEAERLIEMDKR